MTRLLVVLLLLGAVAGGCGDGNEIIIGATTSVQDSGLLDPIMAAFEEASGHDVKPVVAGSGQVLELARNGELDVIMTHSPAEEEAFISDGDGLDRTPVMQNFFLIAGPADDPAGVGDASTLAEAFALIAEGKFAFISRGDGSGTHRRELATWAAAGIDPSGESWYRESATGQGQNILVASDDGAYTLADSSTFTRFADRVELSELLIDPEEPNVYSVVRISPAEHSDVNEEAANAFVEFMTSDRAREIISGYGVEDYGRPLFEVIR